MEEFVRFLVTAIANNPGHVPWETRPEWRRVTRRSYSRRPLSIIRRPDDLRYVISLLPGANKDRIQILVIHHW
jgi:hypothetical protein